MRIFIIAGTIIILACSAQSPLDERALLRWINDPANGLVKSSTINKLTIEVKYLPAKYLVTNELRDKNFTDADVLTLFDQYNQSMAFLLTVRPQDGKPNVILNNIRSIEGFKERVLDLNFSFSTKIKMHTHKGTFEPVLTAMENTYDLQGQKSFYILFANSDHQNCLTDATEMDITFYDDVFETGISHFKFRKKDLENVPPLQLHHTILQ